MKTFVANPAQTREFIANFKRACYPLEAYNVTIDESVAIKRRLATFNTLYGKTFVVRLSDLTLVAVTCDVKEQIGALEYMNNLGVFKAPEKEIYSTQSDDNSPTIDAIDPNEGREFKDWIGGRTVWSSEENQFVDWRNNSQSDNLSFVDEEHSRKAWINNEFFVGHEFEQALAAEFEQNQLEAEERFLDEQEQGLSEWCNSTEDDSCFEAPESTTLRSVEEILDNDSSTSVDDDSHSYTVNQQETALKAAKIIFHYWAISGNSWIVPYDYDTLADLIEYLNAQTGKNAFICFVDDSILGVRDLIVDEHSLSFGDDFDLFLQTLKCQAVNYGVYAWFTPSELYTRQQNYQYIVADCTAVLEMYRQSNLLADNGEGEYQLFPKNTSELHDLIMYIQDKPTADSIVESLEGEEHLFFQVLDTLNSINQTKSVGILA